MNLLLLVYCIIYNNPFYYLDSTTPTKDEISLVEEAALLLTPSRHSNEEEVKRTSLFNNEPITTTTPKCALEIDLSDEGYNKDESDDVTTKHETNNNNNKNIIAHDVILEELPCTPPVTDDERLEMAARLTPPDDEYLLENDNVAAFPEAVKLNPSVEKKVDGDTEKDLPSTSRASGESYITDSVSSEIEKPIETVETLPDGQVIPKKNAFEPTKKSFMQFLDDHQPELSAMSEDELLELNTKLESIKVDVFKEIFKRARLK